MFLLLSDQIPTGLFTEAEGADPPSPFEEAELVPRNRCQE